MRRLAALLALFSLGALLACSKHRAGGPAAPGAKLPPDIEAVQPPARAVRIWYDTEIWAQFKEPLDPATVSGANVFLKIDTRRIACSVGYEAATRRIRIVPSAPLVLSETYTVELRPGLATAAGGTFQDTWFWQFTVFGLRRITTPKPDSGATGEPPLAPLSWSGSETSAGEIVYDVFAGEDSTAVAERRVSALSRSTKAYLVPELRWSLGVRQFWSVTAINQTTLDTLRSPVWSFETLSPNAPIDSVRFNATEWAYYQKSNRFSFCYDVTVRSGPPYHNGFSYEPRALGLGRRLANAYLRVNTQFVSDPPGSSLWSITASFKGSPCRLGDPGPPFLDELLADKHTISPFVQHYESDVLTAHVQAMVRELPVYGFSFTSPASLNYAMPAQLILYYYR